MGSSRPPGPALVADAADADPVTLLALAWLSARRSENTRIAYARDIGITPQRLPGPNGARTAALVALRRFTGARLSEIINADISDLATRQGHPVLWVTRGKSRQDLPLPGPAAARIDTYLAGRPGPQDVPALFA